MASDNNPLKNKTIGVFFGSRSPEHDVSVITGELIVNTLSNHGYNVIPVYIAKNGDWYTDQKLASLDFFKSEGGEKELKEKLSLSTQHYFNTIQKCTILFSTVQKCTILRVAVQLKTVRLRTAQYVWLKNLKIVQCAKCAHNTVVA